MNGFYTPKELRQQAIANARIEGIFYTPEEIALFAYFDREQIDAETRIKLIHEFSRGEFEVPAAA